MSRAALCLLAILANVGSAEAGPGLRGQPPPHQMNRTDVESQLLSDFRDMLNDGAANKHTSSIEVELFAMYPAMPKDGDGLLGHTVVRYMLHRFFVQKYGWFIRGLEPGNASALQALTAVMTQQVQTTGMLDWVPSYMQKFVEELEGGRGLHLLEVAVLATTLEHLIHKEANQRLEKTFNALELPFSTMLNEQQMRSVLEVYMVIYLNSNTNVFSGMSSSFSLKFAHDEAVKNYRDWGTLQQWMHSVHREVMHGSVEKPLDFKGVSRVVEEVGRRHGKYFEAECGDIRAALLKVESTKAGRVRLADYYKQSLSGVETFEFTEKIEFLRALGVIDDSNPYEPHVIVANYIVSRPNCVRASDFYVVCCRNECEDLMTSIEKKFEKPTASPAQILGLVATLSTETVKGPRNISDTLVGRLNSIAEANEGEVPLHGRLFAQWLHHAFPRECPYPQTHAVAPLIADESTGLVSAEATHEEMQAVVDSDDCTESRWEMKCCLRKLPVGEKAREHQLLPENELPWDDSEELLQATKKAPHGVVTMGPPVQKEPSRMALISFIFLAGAACAWKLMPQNKKSAGWQDGLLV